MGQFLVHSCCPCIENAAACLIPNLLIHDPLQSSIQWFSVTARIKFRTCLCIPGIKRLCTTSMHHGSKLHAAEVFNLRDPGVSFPKV